MKGGLGIGKRCYLLIPCLCACLMMFHDEGSVNCSTHERQARAAAVVLI